MSGRIRPSALPAMGELIPLVARAAASQEVRKSSGPLTMARPHSPLAARQYALLFIHHGAEERVGVDKPLHQQVCLSEPGHSHGGAGGGLVVGGGNDVEEGISRYLAGQVFKIKVFRNKKPGLNKTFGCAAHKGLECGAVGAAHHCHAPPTPLGFKRGGERGEIQNGLHKNKGRGNKSLAKIVQGECNQVYLNCRAEAYLTKNAPTRYFLFSRTNFSLSP